MSTTTTTYEVTLPVIVTVTTRTENGKTVLTDVSKPKIDGGWGGMFSEAEDALGVWNTHTMEWDRSEEAQAASAHAALALFQALL